MSNDLLGRLAVSESKIERIRQDLNEIAQINKEYAEEQEKVNERLLEAINKISSKINRFEWLTTGVMSVVVGIVMLLNWLVSVFGISSADFFGKK